MPSLIHEVPPMTKGHKKHFPVIEHRHSKLTILMIVATKLESITSYAVYDRLICIMPKTVELFMWPMSEIVAERRVQLLRLAYD